MNRRSLVVGDLESRITLRFTALVVAILVLGITIFVAVDTVAVGMRLDATLGQKAVRLAQRFARVPKNAGLPANARIVSPDGEVIRAGEQPMDASGLGPREGLGYLDSPRGPVRVFAVRLGDGSFLQLLDSERPDVIDTLQKALVLLAIAVLVGASTYLLGLGFSRRALAPVRESLARLERFTADAGHELRTPLASARAALDVAERTGDWTGGVARSRVELDRASMLVDRLLELARLDPSTLRRESVNLAHLCAQVVRVCAPGAAERAVSVAIEGTSAETIADPILLERLVMNLVTNAIRFAEDGSAVTVRFDDDTIEVHNVGVPIPPADITRIFEPFYQSERSRTSEGAGLGLAIAAVIAEAHGWSLGATSSPEDGTTFTVRMRHATGPSRS